MKIIIKILVALIFSNHLLYSKEILNFSVIKSHEKLKSGNVISLILKVKLDEGWHINSNKPNEDYLIPTEVTISSDKPILISDVIYPEGKNVSFGFTEQPVSVFEKNFDILLKLKVSDNLDAGKVKVHVKLKYQGCNEQSCLPPQIAEVPVEFEIVKYAEEELKVNEKDFINFESIVSKKVSARSIQDSTLPFSTDNIFLSIIFIFLGGLALNLTPCVYPLIPITLGYFGGQSESKTSRLFFLASIYVLGMAITYSTIGVITALSGSMFGALLQNPFVLIGIALALILLSLSMFGLYEFQLPSSLTAKIGGSRGGLFGALFMGLTMGIVAAPCVGPFVIGLLTLVAAKGDVFYGFLMFFVLALGLGTPYLFLGVFSGKIQSLPRSGEWMIAVKKIFGFVLIGMAIYFLLPLVPDQVSKFILPSYIVLASVYLIVFDKSGSSLKTFQRIKTASLTITAIIGIWLLVPSEKESVRWQVVKPNEIVIGNEMPTIIDFYADWCVPCKELDAITFVDPAVVAESRRFRTLKVDLTVTDSEETRFAMKNFGIVGVPTLIFYDSEGNEIRRINSFVNAKELLEILKGIY